MRLNDLAKTKQPASGEIKINICEFWLQSLVAPVITQLLSVLTVFEERESPDQMGMFCGPAHFPGHLAELRTVSVEIKAFNTRIMMVGHQCKRKQWIRIQKLFTNAL